MGTWYFFFHPSNRHEQVAIRCSSAEMSIYRMARNCGTHSFIEMLTNLNVNII